MTDSSADPKIERAALESALKQLTQKQPDLAKRRPWALLLVVAMAVGFAGSWLDLPVLNHPVFLAIEPLLALGLGAVTTYLVYRSVVKVQWLFLAPYVDRAALESRLRELGP